MKKLGPTDDLQDGEVRVFDRDGESWLVARVRGVLHAVSNECGHLPQRMDGAELEGDCLRCPHHGCGFDVATGDVRVDMGFFALEPLRVAPVVERDGVAWIET